MITTCDFAPYHAIISGLEFFLIDLEGKHVSYITDVLISHFNGVKGAKFKINRDRKNAKDSRCKSQGRLPSVRKNVQTITLMLMGHETLSKIHKSSTCSIYI